MCYVTCAPRWRIEITIFFNQLNEPSVHSHLKVLRPSGCERFISLGGCDLMNSFSQILCLLSCLLPLLLILRTAIRKNNSRAYTTCEYFSLTHLLYPCYMLKSPASLLYASSQLTWLFSLWQWWVEWSHSVYSTHAKEASHLTVHFLIASFRSGKVVLRAVA